MYLIVPSGSSCTALCLATAKPFQARPVSSLDVWPGLGGGRGWLGARLSACACQSCGWMARAVRCTASSKAHSTAKEEGRAGQQPFCGGQARCFCGLMLFGGGASFLSGHVTSPACVCVRAREGARAAGKRAAPGVLYRRRRQRLLRRCLELNPGSCCPLQQRLLSAAGGAVLRLAGLIFRLLFLQGSHWAPMHTHGACCG